MNCVLPAGIPSVFTTAGNANNLSVGLSIYDVTSGTPTKVAGPTLMTNYVGNAYYASFTPQAGKSYLAFMAVYTDGTLTTPAPGYSQDVQGFYALPMLPNGDEIVGLIDCGDPLLELALPVFKIFLGDTKTMYMRALSDGEPLDLSACTEIVVNLSNADGTVAQRKLSLGQVVISGPAVLGKFYCPIPGSVSALLNVGEYQSVDVTFTVGGNAFTVQFREALSVFQV